MAKNSAIVITSSFLDTDNAKTAHGLIRGTERFTIVGVIDKKYPGKDAGEILDGRNRNIPVYATLKDFGEKSKKKAKYCIIGVATKGGVLPKELQVMLREAISRGYSIVNGLHDYVSDHPDMVALAKKKKAQIIDVRKPKKFKDLHFWSGEISQVRCPKIAVLGTDCALGKRTTTRFLVQAKRVGCRERNMDLSLTAHSTILYLVRWSMQSCNAGEKPRLILFSLKGNQVYATQADRPEQSG